MNLTVTKSTFSYKTGPNKGINFITRNIKNSDFGYSVNVIKTLGQKTYGVVFASTGIIEGIGFNKAMKIAKEIMVKCEKPMIDSMRIIATNY